MHSVPRDLYNAHNRSPVLLSRERLVPPRVPGPATDAALLLHSRLDVRYVNEAQVVTKKPPV